MPDPKPLVHVSDIILKYLLPMMATASSLTEDVKAIVLDLLLKINHPDSILIHPAAATAKLKLQNSPRFMPDHLVKIVVLSPHYRHMLDVGSKSMCLVICHADLTMAVE